MHRIQAPEDAAAQPPSPPPAPTLATLAAAAAERRATISTTNNDLESQAPPSAISPSPTAGPATSQRTTVQDIVAIISNPESKSCTYQMKLFSIATRGGPDASYDFVKGIIAAFILISMFQVIISSKVLMASLFALHSPWLPQIVRNVKKGSRRALRKRYVLGMTTCRSYFLLCERNSYTFCTCFDCFH